MSWQQEAVREWAWAYGAERPDQEWLNSDFDTWEKNPHYTGPRGRHPEDYYDDDFVAEGEKYGPFQPVPRHVWADEDLPF